MKRAIWIVIALAAAAACSSSHGKAAPLSASTSTNTSSKQITNVAIQIGDCPPSSGASLIAPSAILAPFLAWFEVDHAKIEDGRFVAISGLTELRSGKPAFTPKTAFALRIGGSIEMVDDTVNRVRPAFSSATGYFVGLDVHLDGTLFVQQLALRLPDNDFAFAGTCANDALTEPLHRYAAQQQIAPLPFLRVILRDPSGPSAAVVRKGG